MNLINLLIALGAGMVSITSPCCLPLLPGYVGYMSGVTVSDAGSQRNRAVVAALLFVAGFTAVFAALGATASAIGHLLLTNRGVLGVVAGTVVLAAGLLLLLDGRIGWLARGGWNASFGRGRLWAAPLLGAAFAITWTPCIGPVLGAILTLAATTNRVTDGVALLVAYSLGLGIPFIALSLSLQYWRNRLRDVGRRVALVRQLSGAVLVSMGVLLVTGLWFPLMRPLLRLYAQVQWPPF